MYEIHETGCFIKIMVICCLSPVNILFTLHLIDFLIAHPFPIDEDETPIMVSLVDFTGTSQMNLDPTRTFKYFLI